MLGMLLYHASRSRVGIPNIRHLDQMRVGIVIVHIVAPEFVQILKLMLSGLIF
jgi:hypothetical protein